jgi:hypothetical protein
MSENQDHEGGEPFSTTPPDRSPLSDIGWADRPCRDIGRLVSELMELRCAVRAASRDLDAQELARGWHAVEQLQLLIAMTPASDEGSLWAKVSTLAQRSPSAVPNENYSAMIRAAIRVDMCRIEPASAPAWVKTWLNM